MNFQCKAKYDQFHQLKMAGKLLVVANTAGKLETRKRKSLEAEFTQPRTSACIFIFSCVPVQQSVVDLSAHCQNLQYHVILCYCRFTGRTNMPKTKIKKGFKNQCFNAWHTEWNSSSDKLVGVADIGGFTNVFKEIGKQKLSKAIEYRNTTRICVDCLQSSMIKKEFHCPS